MTRRTLFLLCVAIATLRIGDSALGAGGAAGRPTLPVSRVDDAGFTVADMDRSVEFYTRVLSFTKASDVEVSGRDYELLSGVFGASARVVHLTLGDEQIELTQYHAPAWTSDSAGRPQQRSQLPARRHHRQRHGEGVRTVETSRCCAGIDRAAASP